MKHTVRARFNPFDADPPIKFQAEQGRSISEIVASCPELPKWFCLVDPEYGPAGEVRINGKAVARGVWDIMRPRLATSYQPIVITLHAKLQGGKTGSTKNILTTVAAIALVAGATLVSGGLLGPAGIGLLGASFAAGGLGASAAAAGLGLAATLLLSTLTPPPVSSSGGGSGPATSQAGISGNQLKPLEELPAILGLMRFSPPILSPAYTTFENGTVTVHAVVGLAGHYDISDVLVNGNQIAEFPEAESQIRTGTPSDEVLTICNKTVIEERRGTPLPNFVMELKDSHNDRLVHQDDPDRDLPQWQLYRTRGEADQIWIRLFWPGGIARSFDDTLAFMPVRLEIKPRGTSTWLKMPVVHFQCLKKNRASMRKEIKLIFENSGGPRVNHDMELDTFAAYGTTGDGETIEYNAESYFANTVPTDQLPVMTAATTSGVTMSASSQQLSQHPWLAADSSLSTNWQSSLAGAFPQWLKARFSAPITAKSFMLRAPTGVGNEVAAGKDFTFEGSNNDTDWTVIGTYAGIDNWTPDMNQWFQVQDPGSYADYRVVFTDNNGHASDIIVVNDFRIGLTDAAGINTGSIYASHVHLTNDGAEIYLDPATFPIGEYDVRIQRGLAAEIGNFVPDNYTYSGSVIEANFFEYVTVSGNLVVEIGQNRFSSETMIEQFSTVSDDYPFSLDVHHIGVSMIAVEIPNLTIESLSALFHSIVPIWQDDVWSTDAVSSNPAELYRHVLLGQENALKLPGEIIDEDKLQAWAEFCDDEGHEFNAVLDGKSVLQVLLSVAAGGYGVPTQGNGQWGAIFEHDRSAETPVQVFTPLNTRNLVISKDFNKLPHAIRAEFFDEDDDWSLAETTVYMDGYDATNAERIESITYEGFTNLAKVQARALFDLRQMYLRKLKYSFEIGIEGLISEKGDLVLLIHDVVDRHHGFARITEVHLAGPNVTGLTLEASVDFGSAAGEIDTAFEAVFRFEDGTTAAHAVNETTESNTVTFVTPFADPGADVLKATGLVGFRLIQTETRRMLVFAIEYIDELHRRITLVDEALGLHA